MNFIFNKARIPFIALSVIFCVRNRFCEEISTTTYDICQVAGKVIDQKDSLPISNAGISVTGSTAAVNTDTDGLFKMSVQCAASCTLTVTKSGYKQSVVYIDSDTEYRSIEVILEPQPLSDLEKLIVRGQRTGRDINSEDISSFTISQELITKLPGIGQADMFRSMQLLPGVNGTNETSSGLYVRGGTPDQNLIVLDGIPVYYVDHFYGFFSAFNPQAIDEITLHKGGFGPQWGGRLSSVVEMSSSGRSRKYTSDGIKVNAGTGFLSSDLFVEIPVKNNELGTIMLAERRSMTDFYQTDLFDRIFNRMHGSDTLSNRNNFAGRPPLPGEQNERIVYQPDFKFWDVNGCASFRLGSHGSLSTTLFMSRDEQNNTIDTTWSFSDVFTRQFFSGPNRDSLITLFDTTTRTTALKQNEPLFWGNQCFGQEWKQQWTDAYTTQINWSYSQFTDKKREDYLRTDSVSNRFSDTTSPKDTTFISDSWMASKNRITDISGKFHNSLTLSNWNILKTGVEISRKAVTYERDTIQPDTTDSYSGSLPPGVSDPFQPVHSYDTGVSVAVYAQDEIQFHDNAGLMLGGRLYYFNLSSVYAFDPRISGWWRPLPDIKLKGALGEYTQEIHRAELEDITGGSKAVWLLSSDTRPLEKSRQIIGGISMEKNHLLLDAEFYLKQYSGLLTVSERMRPMGAMGETFNPEELALFEGAGSAYGMELLAQVKNVQSSFLSKKLTYNGWIAYTLSRIENTYDVFNKGEPFPATHDHTHEIKLINNLEWNVTPWSSLNLGAIWLYSSGTPYTAPLGTYTLWLVDSTTTHYYQHVSEKNKYRLPDYHRFDCSLTWKIRFSDRVQSGLTFGLFNAYNNDNILERSYTSSSIGWFRFDNMDTPTTTTTRYTTLDKKSMSVTANIAFAISARF